MADARKDLRDAFGQALEAYGQWQEGEPEPRVSTSDGMVPMSKVCSLLWDSGDTVPTRVLEELKALPGIDEDKVTNTYSSAAREFAALIKSTKAKRATAQR